MELKLKLVLVFFFVLVRASGGDGLRITGENLQTDPDTKVAFLDRFVFEPNGQGVLEYTITIAANYCCPDVAIFSGWSSQWPAVREQMEEMTCYEIIDRATATIQIWGDAGHCETFVDDTDGVEKLRCTGRRTFEYSKDQWYYIAAMNCHHAQNLGIELLEYDLHFVNDDEAGLLKEFSADESTNLPVSLVFTIILTFLFLVGVIFGVQLGHQKLLHVTYQLWIISLLLHTVGILVLAWGWLNFAFDGNRRDETELAGHICKAVGTVTFASMLVLIAKGYTITRLTMRDIGKLKLAFFVIGFAASHVTLYIIQRNADPQVVTNIYDTPAALGLIVIRIIGTAWSLYGISFTMKDHPSKNAFYAVFTIFVIGWFMGEPVVAFLSTFCLPLYCRAKFVFGFDVAVITLGHFIFIWLIRPSSTNTFFPFHLKTNKVNFDFLYDTDPRNNYKPTKETFDLFLAKIDDAEEGISSTKLDGPKKATDKSTTDSKPPADKYDIFMAGSSRRSKNIPSISTTIPLERMLNCPVIEPPKNLPVKYLENEVTYTLVEDLRLTKTQRNPKYELQPSYKNEVTYTPVEDLRTAIPKTHGEPIRKNHRVAKPVVKPFGIIDVPTTAGYVTSNRSKQYQHHGRSRKNQVQTTPCGEGLQNAQDLGKHECGPYNPDMKVDCDLQVQSGTQKRGKQVCRPQASGFRVEDELQEHSRAQKRGKLCGPLQTSGLRTDKDLQQPSVLSTEEEMDSRKRKIMEMSCLGKGREEYQTLDKATSLENVGCSDINDAENKGDTSQTATTKKKKKKKRNPIHKATKILGMKKKKNPSED